MTGASKVSLEGICVDTGPSAPVRKGQHGEVHPQHLELPFLEADGAVLRVVRGLSDLDSEIVDFSWRLVRLVLDELDLLQQRVDDVR